MLADAEEEGGEHSSHNRGTHEECGCVSSAHEAAWTEDDQSVPAVESAVDCGGLFCVDSVKYESHDGEGVEKLQ